MSENDTTHVSLEDLDDLESRTDWKRLESISDEEIEAAVESDPDAKLLDADWFEKAQVVNPSAEKKRITIRLDEDIIEYFKQQGSGYQTRINDVLRAFILSKQWVETPKAAGLEEGEDVVILKRKIGQRDLSRYSGRFDVEKTPENKA